MLSVPFCDLQWALLLQGTPHPGVFVQRVRNRLKIKELSFWRVQKSA
jgi:hypothetical protein